MSNDNMRHIILVVATIVLTVALPRVQAAARLVGELPRAANAPLESLPGVDTEYSDFQASDGSRIRTVVTRPEGRTERLPAIQFVQWLSCDTIEVTASDHSGWAKMLKRLVTQSNVLVLRTEKPGVGDSRGPACSALDYNTELAYHQQSLQRLLARPDVDPAKVVIFGASIGATFAPLIARNQPVAGVAVWGGGARTWYERQLAFDRRAMDLSGRSGTEVGRAMTRHAEFQWLYLQQKLTPAEISSRRPDLADVWADIIGTEKSLHYGRPFAFQWQAQEQDWAAAWSQVQAPVLVLVGEFDWYEDPRSAELIARIVNGRTAAKAEFHIVPGIDHHFTRYPNAEAAFREKGGSADPDQAVDILLGWLGKRLK